MRALVVDDSNAMRRILIKILNDLNFETFEARHGQEGLVKLDELGAVDLALIDWNMPIMNGYELVLKIRECSDFDKTRIIMVTTETGVTEINMALTAGADEYIMKPFTKRDVLSKLQHLGI